MFAYSPHHRGGEHFPGPIPPRPFLRTGPRIGGKKSFLRVLVKVLEGRERPGAYPYGNTKTLFIPQKEDTVHVFNRGRVRRCLLGQETLYSH